MEKQQLIARVILEHYHDKLDHLFDYSVPSQHKSLITQGMRVLVPFGKGNRMLEAFVMELRPSSDRDSKLKPIYEIIDLQPVLSREQLTMVEWMKKTYLCRTIEAIRCFVPKYRAKQKTFVVVQLHISPQEATELVKSFKRAPVQQSVLCCLIETPVIALKELMEKSGAGRSSIMALVKKNIVKLTDNALRRNPHNNSYIVDYPEPVLSKLQQHVMKSIESHWEQEPLKAILIHGITGSGKTEIYLRLIKKALVNEQDSIMLVPEISLTPQMVQRFRGRFGDRVAVLHSHLSEGERLDEWQRIRQGEARIVIGPRSAIFAPCRNLGMIILDEEHESTYKSEQSPRYHALEIAQLRSRTEGAQLVLGTATPMIETYHLALQKHLKLICLKERATGGVLPDVTVVDLRDEVRQGNPSLFSKVLSNELKDCFAQGHQAILLLNRRAFSTYLNCMNCGYVIKCEHCDITMKWHKADKKLKCHYCGEQRAAPQKCPECEAEISFQGAGTQKAEEALKELFPDRVVKRMDQDSTRQKGAHQSILEEFESGAIDILIGTQMIAKGLDFPNVTLVGILLADTSLNLPDFRASERTFQLITQVAGRAGRGAKKGKVVLQTYQPEHYAIQSASRQDYEGFYHQEIMLRREFNYPPFVRLIQVTFSGKDEQEVSDTAIKIARSMSYLLEQKGYGNTSEMIMEPGPALISRMENRYRYTLLMRTSGVSFSFLKRMVKYLLIDKKDQQIPENMTITIDLDPLFVS